MIRPATLTDIDSLLKIERACFTTDRLSRRNFRYLLTKAHAQTLVAEHSGQIQGYALLLLSNGTSMARLYSFAVALEYQRQGIAKALFNAIEQCALQQDCISLRLETRQDNHAMQQLVKQCGYKKFGIIAHYYEDQMEALRFEKSLAPQLRPALIKVPYYQQSLEFTCGPAALMMAMQSLKPQFMLDRKLELRIWRESTTIFMTSGHGGCGPYGLALAAFYRGFDVDIYVNDPGALFVHSVRSPLKKEVIRLVQEDFLAEIETLPIQLHYTSLTVAELKTHFEAGAMPIVLISSYRLYKEKFPHWVVVTGFDDKYIYVHDPFVDAEHEETVTDCINMPILQKDFERMARYGKSAQKAILMLRVD
ncbi:MAG: peptidase C39 family protein [Pseudomonadota bacterium]|nr:peptidase C39 family protein [Pseudomonadota bacterium]